MALRLAHGRETRERNRPAPGRITRQPSRQPVSAERLFADLDGRELSIVGQSWQVEPYAVWDAPEQRWIQLSLAGRVGDQRLILTLKLAPGAGIQHAVMALSSWLASPSNRSDILNVA